MKTWWALVSVAVFGCGGIVEETPTRDGDSAAVPDERGAPTGPAAPDVQSPTQESIGAGSGFELCVRTCEQSPCDWTEGLSCSENCDWLKEDYAVKCDDIAQEYFKCAAKNPPDASMCDEADSRCSAPYSDWIYCLTGSVDDLK